MGKVIGYVFDHGDQYKDKHYFDGSAHNIITFVLNHLGYPITITDSYDELLCKFDADGRVIMVYNTNLFIELLEAQAQLEGELK